MQTAKVLQIADRSLYRRDASFGHPHNLTRQLLVARAMEVIMAEMKVIQGSRHVTPHAYPPGKEPAQWVPGDVILTHSPHGLFGRLIRFGEKLRYRSKEDEPYTWFNHAAIVISPDPETGKPRLAEALGDGIKTNPASKYLPEWFAYIDIGADNPDRDEIVEFAEREAELHTEYGSIQIASIAMSLIAGGRLTVGMDGSEICSALVAKALRGAGYWWERGGRIVDEKYLTPADLAASFHTEDIRTEPVLVTPGT